jgi:hypothetical protein
MENRILIADVTSANIHHARAKQAAALAALLAAEYPLVAVVAETMEDDEGREKVVSWTIEHAETGDTILETEDAAVPTIADIVEAAQEAEIDIEGDLDEEEEKSGGNVVPEEYRAKYREVSSTGQSCGDWLAEQLTVDTHGVDGFSVADFAAILDANGVDQSTGWGRLPESGQRGWVGRWRMNGRQVLEKTIALRGVYVGPTGTKHEPEAGWLAMKRTQHVKWIAKQTKIEEAMKPE